MNITHPGLTKEWHPTKNGSITPADIKFGTHKLFWWFCPKTCSQGCPHEWVSRPYNRLVNGCPMCSSHPTTICIHMSIQKTHPDIAKQWHPTKNGDLTPDKVTFGSNKKIWWLCQNTCSQGCAHEWETSPNSRVKKERGCPFCSTPAISICIHDSILHCNPDIVKQWHPTKNGTLSPDNVSVGSGKNIWWLCPKTCAEGCKHEWAAPPINRIKLNSGCPYCSYNQKNTCIHTSIQTTHPLIAAQWHPTKNGDHKPSDYTAGSNIKMWWYCPNICSEGCPHEWETKICNRTKGIGCPYCSLPPKKLCIHSSLEYKNPNLAKQWHPTKNGDLKSTDFTTGSGQKIWWVCKKNNEHEWEATIDHRTNNRQCPYCHYTTEGILYDYIKSRFSSVIAEFKLDSCKYKHHLPFDFCIPELKIIIELDGAQHFHQISNWKSPAESIKRDIFKMRKAIEEGYKIIRLFQEDVYNNNTEWLDINLLPEIEKMDRVSICISTDETLYDRHIEMLEFKDSI
jgi:very-short-patch-repair endonuclease